MDRTWDIPTNGTEGYITDILSGQVSCLSTYLSKYNYVDQIWPKFDHLKVRNSRKQIMVS